MACWTCRICAGVTWPGLGYRFDGLGWCGAGGHEIRGVLRYDPDRVGAPRFPRAPDVEPHSYVPDYMAAGDCRVCGHVAESPVHTKPVPTPPPGQAAFDF